jgi:gluconolactonase
MNRPLLNIFAMLLGCGSIFAADKTLGTIERLDPALDQLIAPGTSTEVLAEGHTWTEGPVWVADGNFLLYSDIPPNSIFRWKEGEGATLWLKPSGYTGTAVRKGEPGSNGLALDPQGRLILCQHGDRRVARLDRITDKPRPEFVTLVDRYEGKRLNSPNDLVFHPNGDLYFTDPPYWLEKNAADPAKELPFQGVYRLGRDGKLTLLTREMTRPNGIALSPDARTLYVANSDPKQALWMAFDVLDDGTIGNGRVFYDATRWVGKPGRPGLPDGMAVDAAGNIFATGPGGVLVFSPAGKLLGRIDTTQPTANCAFGGEEGSTLFITANTHLVRVQTLARGLVNPGVR